MSLELLKKSLRNAPVIKKGEYNYFIHPITDGIPEIDPRIVREIACQILRMADGFEDVDKIVTMEAMGIPIGMALSLMTDIPLVIIRKRKYGLTGEIEIGQETGYSKGNMYINGIYPNDKIIIIDDVVSTGGTLRAVIGALENNKVKINDVIVVIEKGDGAERLKYEGHQIKTIIRIEVDERKVTKVEEMIWRI
jgi:adenine phosphoribosyltransferase